MTRANTTPRARGSTRRKLASICCSNLDPARAGIDRLGSRPHRCPLSTETDQPVRESTALATASQISSITPQVGDHPKPGKRTSSPRTMRIRQSNAALVHSIPMSPRMDLGETPPLVTVPRSNGDRPAHGCVHYPRERGDRPGYRISCRQTSSVSPRAQESTPSSRATKRYPQRGDGPWARIDRPGMDGGFPRRTRGWTPLQVGTAVGSLVLPPARASTRASLRAREHARPHPASAGISRRASATATVAPKHGHTLQSGNQPSATSRLPRQNRLPRDHGGQPRAEDDTPSATTAPLARGSTDRTGETVARAGSYPADAGIDLQEPGTDRTR